MRRTVLIKTSHFQANFNRLLDVARETFKENVADIYELGRGLSDTHGLPLSLVYQDGGFTLQLRKSEAEGELPTEFINVTEKKGRIVFSTLDLVCRPFGVWIFRSWYSPLSLGREEKAKCEDERCIGRGDVPE